jgi:hypothetical protein
MTLSIYSMEFFVPWMIFLVIPAVVIGCISTNRWNDFNLWFEEVIVGAILCWILLFILSIVVLYVHWFVFNVVMLVLT